MKASLPLAALLALTALPAAAQAPPVTIQSCNVLQYQRPIRAREFWYPWGPGGTGGLYTDGLQIAYVNNSTKTASRVAFLVNYRGDVQHVVDAGTFSPGVTINHTFGQFTGDAFLGNRPNVCRVAAVRFSDGSVWRSNNLPRRQATQ